MRPRAYLAGTFDEPWRDRLTVIGSIEWLSPRVAPNQEDKAKRDPKVFTPRDLVLLNLSDFVVGYFSPTAHNVGLSWEIGYAYARGKPIGIYIPEESLVRARSIRGLVSRFDSWDALFEWCRYMAIEEART